MSSSSQITAGYGLLYARNPEFANDIKRLQIHAGPDLSPNSIFLTVADENGEPLDIIPIDASGMSPAEHTAEIVTCLDIMLTRLTDKHADWKLAPAAEIITGLSGSDGILPIPSVTYIPVR